MWVILSLTNYPVDLNSNLYCKAAGQAAGVHELSLLGPDLGAKIHFYYLLFQINQTIPFLTNHL